MAKIVYLDTNIIIDLFEESRPCYESSKKIIQGFMSDKECEIFINTDSLTTFFYIVRHQIKMPFEEAILKMELLTQAFSIVSYAQDEVLEALELCKNEKFNDYEDTIQYVCAKKVNADLIVTNDKGFISLEIEIRGTK